MSPAASLAFKRKLIAIAVFLALVAGAIGTEKSPGVLAQGQQRADLAPPVDGAGPAHGGPGRQSPWARDPRTLPAPPVDHGQPRLAPLN